MPNMIKAGFTILIFLFISNAYAITVNVQSTNKSISALGFTVNGKNHGGMGSTYSANNMPTGKYSFGIRVGGVISGDDIPCRPSDGSNYINLTKDTTAILAYSGQKCIVQIH